MRISKTDYYLNIAREVATRSTCLRRKYGAVIVKDDQIISTGYNGSPRGEINCCDTGICEREQLKIRPGERYELCKSVHAEQNACLHAGRNEAMGATLYLVGIDAKTDEVIPGKPCMMCERIIKQCGIKKVVSIPDTLKEGE